MTRFGGALAALMILLAACAPNGDNEGAGDDQTAEAEDESTATNTEGGDESGANDAEGSSDEPLRFAHPQANDILDPHRLNSGNALQAVFPAVDRLVHQAPATGELEPGLATEWERVEDDVLELRLRQEVEFHDGATFDADAVAANFERMATLEDASPAIQSMISPIADVEVVDAFTVRLHAGDELDAEANLNWAMLEVNLAENAGMMLSPAAFDDHDEMALRPVGAGPYTVVDHEPGVKTTYERFDGHWDDTERAAELVIESIDSAETRLSALRDGSIDLTFVEPAQLSVAEGIDGVGIHASEGLAVWTMWLNHALNPWLAEREFRQAMMYAVDRQGMAEALTFGTAEPTVQPFPPAYWAHSDDMPPETYARDLDKVQELLDEVGYDGEPVELMVQDIEFFVQLGEVVQDQMREAGINIEILPADAGQFGRFTVDGEVESFIGRRARTDPLRLINDGHGHGGSNPSGYVSDELDELLRQAAAAPPDSDEHRDLVRQASAHVSEDAHAIYFFTEPVVWTYREGCVDGFEFPLTQYYEFRGVTVAGDC